MASQDNADKLRVKFTIKDMNFRRDDYIIKFIMHVRLKRSRNFVVRKNANTPKLKKNLEKSECFQRNKNKS